MSVPFLIIIALKHYIACTGTPAQGDFHHIIFGQLAMLNVGIMLSFLLTKSLNRQFQTLIIISISCGIATAVMSQARGVWLVFPICILVVIYYALKEKHISANNVGMMLTNRLENKR